ncbi:chemotaxis protein CheB [soil metagenome]
MVASAGGLSAFTLILAELPADFPVPILVMLHLDPHHRSQMAELLGRQTKLRVREAVEGGHLAAGTVSVATPDHHLLVRSGGRLELTQTERVRFVRPSADLLLESLAESFGSRAVAVVLTGSGRDGADGARALKAKGGRVLVQDPATAQSASMPSAVIRAGCASWVLPLKEIAPALIRLARGGNSS